MKTCPYCGAKHPDDALACRIDGTPLPDPSVGNHCAESLDRGRLKRLRCVLHYLIPVLSVALLYLLSLGPISRYGAVTVYQGSITTTNESNGSKIVLSNVVEVRYPHWVRVVYYPAFQVLSGSHGSAFYQRYIHWWLWDWDRPPGNVARDPPRCSRRNGGREEARANRDQVR